MSRSCGKKIDAKCLCVGKASIGKMKIKEDLVIEKKIVAEDIDLNCGSLCETLNRIESKIDQLESQDGFPVYWVDVFAEALFEGNPLKVILDAGCLTSDQMLNIAAEFGGVESLFIRSTTPVNGEWPVRTFLPTTELPFAGHPTIGGSFVIRDVYTNNTADSLAMNYVGGAGRVDVEFVEQSGKITPFFTTGPAAFKNIYTGQQIIDLAAAIQVDPQFIIDNPATPVQTVDTGLNIVMLPFVGTAAGLAALKSIDFFDPAVVAGLDAWLAASDALGIYFFTSFTGEPETQIYARTSGGTLVKEDIATGSAASDLSAWVAKYQFFGSSSADFSIRQGVELQRPSLLFASATAVNGEVNSTRVGGNNEYFFKDGKIQLKCE